MKTSVFIGRCTTYDIPSIRTVIEEGFQALGGIDRYLSNHHKILIKPNLLISSKVAKGVCTRPEVIAGILEILKNHQVNGISSVS